VKFVVSEIKDNSRCSPKIHLWPLYVLACVGSLLLCDFRLFAKEKKPPAISPETTTAETATAETATAETTPNTPADPQQLLPRYQKWLQAADLLITDAEREVFLSIEENYQRDHFIRRFWKARDPFERTTRNEFQDLWEARIEAARQRFENLTSERAKMLLYFGEPSRRNHYNCTDVLRPLEIWVYDEGTERIRGYFTLTFVGLASRGRGLHRQWLPEQGLTRLLGTGRAFGSSDASIAQSIARQCTRGDEVLSSLSQSLDISRLESKALLLPDPPNDEWVRNFSARSTNIAENATLLSGELAVSFPGRHQSRTVVQGMVAIPRGEVEPSQIGEHRSYNLLIDGEILRQGDLFDRFRYRFDFPLDVPSEELPLVVQRYLRPGTYDFIIKVEDVNSQRVFREQRTVVVPRIDKAAAAVEVTAPLSSPTQALASATSSSAAVPREPPRFLRQINVRLEEANASISTGDHTIQILPLPKVMTVGKVRIGARIQGEGIASVAFELNDRRVMRKRKPPWSVELNLGEKPRFHQLRAIALDAEGNWLANDEVTINAGPHRFSVRLIEPQSGRAYRNSVRAHAEVDIPEGERLERMEFYLNDSLVATLYQPPFEQPILFNNDEPVSYVRAVAYLRDGISSEDVQFINAPDYIDEVDIQFVELFTTVTNRKGDLVEDLQPEDFSVLEDGKAQEVRRFERVRDLPLRTGLVLDTSLSMDAALDDVKEAAYQFFETVLTPRDRAALFTFNDQPRMVVRFTNDKEILAGGLAELDAEGETALYDSIIFSLYYFGGLKGKRAILVLTDGEDSTSTYSFEDAIEFARRTGVSIYVIGLELQNHKSEIRSKMQRLAAETGGELYLIDRVNQLRRVYGEIQAELRSQYLIAYQSNAIGSDDASFREVEIKVHRKGVEAKTIRGYYP
jgi:VWFA-related protein